MHNLLLGHGIAAPQLHDGCLGQRHAFGLVYGTERSFVDCFCFLF